MWLCTTPWLYFVQTFPFIYLLDYKDEVDRRVFKKKIESIAGWENTFKTGSDIVTTRINRQNIWVFKLIASVKSTRNDVESVKYNVRSR